MYAPDVNIGMLLFVYVFAEQINKSDTNCREMDPQKSRCIVINTENEKQDTIFGSVTNWLKHLLSVYTL